MATAVCLFVSLSGALALEARQSTHQALASATVDGQERNVATASGVNDVTVSPAQHAAPAPAATMTPTTTAPTAAAPSSQEQSQLSVDAANMGLVQNSLGGPIYADGSMGANHSAGTWQSLGDQTPFERLMTAAVKQSSTEMDLVITALEYTYRNQLSDGSWSDRGSSPICASDCDFVGTFLFYADLGRGLGLLRDSVWFSSSANTTALRNRMDALRPGITRGLDWLINSPSHASFATLAGLSGNGDTNRPAAATEGAVLVGDWLGNSSHRDTGLQMLAKIEAAQRSDGTFVENTGFDAGYQAVTLNHLWDIYFHYPSGQSTARAALLRGILAGMQREQMQILSTYEINHSGSSRTGCPGGSYAGSYKTGKGVDLVRALAYEANVTSSPSLLTTAQAIAQFYEGHPQATDHCYWYDNIGSASAGTYDVTCSYGRDTFTCKSTVSAKITWASSGASVRILIQSASGNIVAQAEGTDGSIGLHVSAPASAGANYQVIVMNQSSGAITITLTVTP